MNYEILMKKCIELAKLGTGKTSPNPLVGCVVLTSKDEIISTGFHSKYGENHAERDALLKLKNGEEVGGTLVVNLEPCTHFGKTPPCVDLIIERKIKKVVIGMRDVNPIVAGNGIAKLKSANIEVVENVLNEECKKLNEIFIKNHLNKKSFITIKTATTLDGKIATSNGSSKWITGANSREKVKEIREKYDAMMTTSSTIITDNPTMAHSKKIILDRNLKTNLDFKIYKEGEIFLFHSEKHKPKFQRENIHFFATPEKNEKLDLDFIFKKAFELGIMSILIESGGILNGEALQYCDKIYHFIAPKITNDNSSKSCFNSSFINNINECKIFKIEEVKKLSNDILLTYYPEI
ncbi:MAG: bifunctional diaminohydroxyphosphoribosylaminopyrimidine deaminase/5-amino-6-(5-phosphoribosylamino)uracil reductase RibD [Candidatus Gastranaerophilales bacterium]